jgi:hypothetical protein
LVRGGYDASTGDELAKKPASVQALDKVDANSSW